MRLVQLTDCHLFSEPDQTGYAGIAPYAGFKRCLQMAVGSKPDALLITGDISGDDSQASYRHFIALLARYAAHLPFKVIAGNHDNNPYFNSLLAAHTLGAGQPWLIANWALHGLDTRFMAGQGRVKPHELNALRHAMQQHHHRHHLLALHHHPVSSHSWMDRHCLTNTDYLWRQLAGQPVRLMVHGHLHHTVANRHQQLTTLGAPSTCWQWALQPTFAQAHQAAGIRILDLAADGSWQTHIRRVK